MNAAGRAKFPCRAPSGRETARESAGRSTPPAPTGPMASRQKRSGRPARWWPTRRNAPGCPPPARRTDAPCRSGPPAGRDRRTAGRPRALAARRRRSAADRASNQPQPVTSGLFGQKGLNRSLALRFPRRHFFLFATAHQGKILRQHRCRAPWSAARASSSAAAVRFSATSGPETIWMAAMRGMSGTSFIGRPRAFWARWRAVVPAAVPAPDRPRSRSGYNGSGLFVRCLLQQAFGDQHRRADRRAAGQHARDRQSTAQPGVTVICWS